MSLSQDIAANVTDRIRQMAPLIDRGADLRQLRVTVHVNPKTGRVRSTVVEVVNEFDASDAGVLTRFALDNA